MKAMVYTKPYEMVLRDEPDPSPAAGEALIRVDAVGICGSDMHGYHGHDPRRVPPLILGHEAAGTVIAGPGAGRRVVVNPLMTCGRCADCLGGRSNLCVDRKLISMNRPGAFAELIAMPAANLIDIPEGLAAVAAAVAEPAATALHALHLVQRATPRPFAECRALVLGGGSIGLLAALWLRSFGCRDVTLAETNALRRASAARHAGCAVHDPATDAPLAESRYHVVIDAVGGTATRATAIRCVRQGGTIVHIGLLQDAGEANFRKLTLQEITFIGTYTYTHLDMQAAVAAIAAGSLGELAWVEQRALADGPRAFEDLDKGRAAAAKIVLLPGMR